MRRESPHTFWPLNCWRKAPRQKGVSGKRGYLYPRTSLLANKSPLFCSIQSNPFTIPSVNLEEEQCFDGPNGGNIEHLARIRLCQDFLGNVPYKSTTYSGGVFYKTHHRALPPNSCLEIIPEPEQARFSARPEPEQARFRIRTWRGQAQGEQSHFMTKRVKGGSD